MGEGSSGLRTAQGPRVHSSCSIPASLEPQFSLANACLALKVRNWTAMARPRLQTPLGPLVVAPIIVHPSEIFPNRKSALERV